MCCNYESHWSRSNPALFLFPMNFIIPADNLQSLVFIQRVETGIIPAHRSKADSGCKLPAWNFCFDIALAVCEANPVSNIFIKPGVVFYKFFIDFRKNEIKAFKLVCHLKSGVDGIKGSSAEI